MALSEANTVWAMDPHNPDSLIKLACHPQTISKIVEAGWRFKIGEYWGLVHGNPPANPLREIDSAAGFPALRKPAAVFQGLKRPMHNVHSLADRDVLIYVANPPHTYSYKDHIEYGGILESWKKPESSVFTTFISLNAAHVDGAIAQVPNNPREAVRGVVLFWEWTESGPKEPSLPYDSAIRYDRRIYPHD